MAGRTRKVGTVKARRRRALAYEPRHALNAVCPYFTMFPLEYPLRVLKPVRLRSFRKPLVCDPYCGRGTSVYAARLRDLPVYGIDVAPVAVAIARAKLASSTVEDVMELLAEIQAMKHEAITPAGAFWRAAFHPKTLNEICHVRDQLKGRRSHAANLLRATLLGALHGPQSKDPARAAYLSNQMPRTFSAKPDYAVRFWSERKLRAKQVSISDVVRTRVTRLLKHEVPAPRSAMSAIQCADSRNASSFRGVPRKITHVVTSPPYYGLRTYAQDQWLRHWFLGGPAEVDYASDPGLDHGSPDAFAKSLAQVWDNVGQRASSRVRMYVRFGGIQSRSGCPDEIFRQSLEKSEHPWVILHRTDADTADSGKRQALQMSSSKQAVQESDYVIGLR